MQNAIILINLIESYGSGIRRSKDALLENGSPALEFYPDNEADNYTNAVMRINEEFLKDWNDGATQETTKEISRIQEQIVLLMKDNPSITAEQIANTLKEISADGVRYHIRNLKTYGVIRREGSTKTGKWIVLK